MPLLLSTSEIDNILTAYRVLADRSPLLTLNRETQAIVDKLRNARAGRDDGAGAFLITTAALDVEAATEIKAAWAVLDKHGCKLKPNPAPPERKPA